MSVTTDDDFAGYVGARWPTLVRTLVLMGCPLDDAPDVVTAGLGRVRRGWREATEHDDLEVVVHRAVLDAWRQRLRGRWWAGLRARTDDEWPLPDLSVLDRLTPDVRAGLVLRRFAGLDAAQAAAVAGREAGGPLPSAPDGPALVAVGERVMVLAPADLDAVTADPRRARRWVAASVALAVLAVALVVWSVLASRGADPAADDDELGPVEPQRSSNPAEVGWYADGVLHLANATYALPAVRDLAVLGSGAVYGDGKGRVVLLADDGTRTQVGTKNPTVPLVASDDVGWVAWIDPTGTVPHLRVYDVGLADVIGDVALPSSRRNAVEERVDTRPVAIDQETVFFVTADGARAWRPIGDSGQVEALETPELYDVASANRVYQGDPRTIVLDHPVFDQAPRVPGRGGELSEDGNYVLTRSPDDGSLVVYEFNSADQVDVHPPDEVTVLDAALAPLGSITYLTLDPEDPATQEQNDNAPPHAHLLTCGLADGECREVATFVVGLSTEAPVLAH